MNSPEEFILSFDAACSIKLLDLAFDVEAEGEEIESEKEYDCGRYERLEREFPLQRGRLGIFGIEPGGVTLTFKLFQSTLSCPNIGVDFANPSLIFNGLSTEFKRKMCPRYILSTFYWIYLPI